LTPDGKVVLISSGSGEWILPKGGWEKDETAQEGAARESHEEAGVLGLVQSEALADLIFSNKKGEPCRLLLFAMEVTEMLVEWPESNSRRRRVFTLDEALTACGKKEHREALQTLKLRGMNEVLENVRQSCNNCAQDLNNEAVVSGGGGSISSSGGSSSSSSDGATTSCSYSSSPGLASLSSLASGSSTSLAADHQTPAKEKEKEMAEDGDMEEVELAN
jgi:diphosphoinositol-polyphosphate diphosphatase